MHELRVTAYCTSYELLFAYELRVNFNIGVTTYFLTMRCNKDKDDKAVYDNKVMRKNYSVSTLTAFFNPKTKTIYLNPLIVYETKLQKKATSPWTFF